MRDNTDKIPASEDPVVEDIRNVVRENGCIVCGETNPERIHVVRPKYVPEGYVELPSPFEISIFICGECYDDPPKGYNNIDAYIINKLESELETKLETKEFAHDEYIL